MSPRTIILTLIDQLPLKRLWRNFRNGNLRGVFHIRAHLTHGGTPKVRYGSKESALKAATSMTKKKPDAVFATYRCPRCGGYHIGKNRPSWTIE